MKPTTIRPEKPSHTQSAGKRCSSILFAAFAVMALLAFPVSSQEVASGYVCGPHFSNSQWWCNLFGKIWSPERCSCEDAQVDLCVPQQCEYNAEIWNPVMCRCQQLYVVIPKVRPLIPKAGWHEIPAGTITWTDESLLIHRGDSTFIQTDVGRLSLAIDLALRVADTEDIQAQGLKVIEAERD
jgi:hypothetical protein